MAEKVRHIAGDMSPESVVDRERGRIARSRSCLLLWVTGDGAVQYEASGKRFDGDLALMAWVAAKVMLGSLGEEADIPDEEPAS